MSFEQRDRTRAAAPLHPFGQPPAPPATEPVARWPRIRVVLLVVAFAAAVALAVVAMTQHRAIFVVAAGTFALLPVAYLVGGAIRGARTGWRAAEVAAAVALVGALAASTVVTIGGCAQRVGPDAGLAGCDLRAAELAGEDLSGADLTGAILSGANLRRANLAGANLTRADLSGAILEDATLSAAVLVDARLDDADLANADLGQADLSGARLASLDLSTATLTGVTLDGADVSGADLQRADLAGVAAPNLVAPGVDLRDADLQGADLSGAALAGARLDRVNLSDAAMPDADLGGVSLRHASLDGADLAGADLGEADLGEASLDGTDLGDADLTGAALVGASLRGADLTGAVLAGADVSGASLVDAAGVTDQALAAALAVDVDELGGALIERDVTLEPRRQVLSSVGGACRGDPVDGAGSYERGSFNPMMILDLAGRPQPGFTDKARVAGWEPRAARFADAVACVDDEVTITVESCPYVLEGGGMATIVRQRYERRVVVVDPSTGSVLFDETLQGSTPDACPPTHLFFGPSPSETFAGTHIDFVDVERDLAAFVKGRA